MTAFERICWFYNEMKAGRYPAKTKLIDRFEISEATFKRDLWFMRDRLGCPVEYDKERRGYCLTDDAFEIPSFWFDRAQLLMLIGIAKQFSGMDADGAAGELADLREKLRSLLSTRDGRDVTDLFSFENVEWVRCDQKDLDLLITAMLASHCVRFVYDSAQRGAIAERVVEPYRLHYYMGSWYLVGYCRDQKAPRIFQIGRAAELEILADRFSSPRFDVDAHLASAFGIFKGENVQPAVLRFDPFIARFVRGEVWHKDQALEEHEDGSVTLTVPVANLTEIRMKTLKYGSRVEVIAPESLRLQVLEEARKIIALYSGELGD